MTRLPIYQVDAFADGPFSGNPAAVVPLEEWLPGATLSRRHNRDLKAARNDLAPRWAFAIVAPSTMER
jgi:hypothetical protein